MNPKVKQARINTVARNVWDGICADGFALGPGRMIFNNEKGETLGYAEMWMLKGRPIGRIRTTYNASNNYAGMHSEGFAWEGESYTEVITLSHHRNPKRIRNNI